MEKFSAESFSKLMEQGMAVVDLRNGEEVKRGFIRGSIGFGSIEIFEAYAGAFLGDIATGAGFGPVLLVYGSDQPDIPTRIENSGIPVKGFLEGGYDSWVAAAGEQDMIVDVEPDELIMDIPFDENLVILDIRPQVAFANGHLKGAVNIPLAHFSDPLRLAAVEDKDNLYLLGEADPETILAATFLKKHEMHNLRIVNGGWVAVQKEKKAEIVKDPGMLN